MLQKAVATQAVTNPVIPLSSYCM